MVDSVPDEFAGMAIPNNKLAPHLAKRGIQHGALRWPTSTLSLLRHGAPGGRRLHAGEGGAAPRDRAGLDVRARDPPGAARPGDSRAGVDRAATWGYDPAFKSEMSEYDPPRAKALLDLYGYVDRDGDGWRDQPDGTPLVLEYATQPDQLVRQLHELWQQEHEGDRHPHRVQASPSGPSNLKASRAGKLMMWGVGWGGAARRRQPSLLWATARTRARPTTRVSTCRRSTRCTSGERDARRARARGSDREAKRLAIAYMPYKVHAPPHRHGPVHSPGSWATTATSSCATSGSMSTSTAMPSAARRLTLRDGSFAPPARCIAGARCWPHGARTAAAEPATPRKVLRVRLRVAETSFDPAQDQRPVLAHRHAAHLRGPVRLRPPGAAVKIKPLHGATACRRCPPTSAPGRSVRPGIYFRATRHSRASGASWSRHRTTSTRFKRVVDPRQHEPAVAGILDGKSAWSAWPTLREAALKSKKPFDYDARSRACARSTATRCGSSSSSRGRAFSRRWPPPTCSAPWPARWSSSTATRSPRTRWAPGRSG